MIDKALPDYGQIPRWIIILDLDFWPAPQHLI
jgi:hypothetical protein